MALNLVRKWSVNKVRELIAVKSATYLIAEYHQGHLQSTWEAMHLFKFCVYHPGVFTKLNKISQFQTHKGRVWLKLTNFMHLSQRLVHPSKNFGTGFVE